MAVVMGREGRVHGTIDGQAKVDDLDVIVRIEDDVLGLDIAMHATERLHAYESLEELFRDASQEILGEWLF